MDHMKVPEACRAFWAEFEAVAGEDVSARFCTAFYFHDCEEFANALAQLVLDGTKRATTGLLWSYEAENEALPEVGQLSIVTDFAGAPLCVIEATTVDVVPFEDVTEAYANREGEGDKSLRYWRDAHWSFFERECERIGKEPSARMLVVCEEFDVVYPKSK